MPLPAKTIGLIFLVSFPATLPNREETPTWLALGDSYTIGESVSAGERYPQLAVDLLRQDHFPCQDPDIVAATGWTTADLLAALRQQTAPHPLLRDNPYSVVTLLIGVNNQYQGRSLTEYREQFTLLLQQSIALAGGNPAHVIVLSIPDYSGTPFAAGSDKAFIASGIDSFNAANAGLSAKYGVHYLDVTADSRKAAADPSLVASDGLHFSGKEYGRWAAALAPLIKEILTNN
jgi:lysophospholipase L1-like esterase